MLPDMSKIQMRLFWWFLNTFVTLAIRNSSHSLLWSSELLLVLFSRESSILSHWSSWGHLTKGVELRNRKTLLKCNTWKHWATDDERMGVAGLLRQKKKLSHDELLHKMLLSFRKLSFNLFKCCKNVQYFIIKMP